MVRGKVSSFQLQMQIAKACQFLIVLICRFGRKSIDLQTIHQWGVYLVYSEIVDANVGRLDRMLPVVLDHFSGARRCCGFARTVLKRLAGATRTRFNAICSVLSGEPTTFIPIAFENCAIVDQHTNLLLSTH